MGINSLPLTESIANNCEQSQCPWFKEGFCSLVGDVLNHMANANISSGGDFGWPAQGRKKAPAINWLNENYNSFENFGTNCVINPVNQSQLKAGELPSVLILNAEDDGQYQDNSVFVQDANHEMLRTSLNHPNKTVVINRLVNIPGPR